jgi:hypothetical protein
LDRICWNNRFSRGLLRKQQTKRFVTNVFDYKSKIRVEAKPKQTRPEDATNDVKELKEMAIHTNTYTPKGETW